MMIVQADIFIQFYIGEQKVTILADNKHILDESNVTFLIN